MSSRALARSSPRALARSLVAARSLARVARYWDFVVSVVLLVTVVTIPLSLGFQMIPRGIDLAIDVLFLVDILKVSTLSFSHF